MAPPKYPCSVCKSNVTNNQEGLKCCICDRWNHKKCGIPDDVFGLASRMEEIQGFHIWSCEGCGIGLMKVHKVMAQQSRDIENLKKEIKDVKESTVSHGTDISGIKEDIIGVKTDIEEMKKAQPTLTESSVYEELSERSSKRKNIVVYGIAESDSPQVEERRNDDTTNILSVFKTMKLSIKAEDIKFISRLGEKVKEGETRPLLIGFKDQDTRDSILQNVRKLANTSHSKVSIVPDLTLKQRQEDKRLLGEKEQRNEKLPEEDAKKWEWKLVGPAGERRLVKVKKKENQTQQDKNSRERLPSQRRTRDQLTDSEEEEETTRPTRKRQC
jgi:hypothetical protein